jgi:hypothetical protein
MLVDWGALEREHDRDFGKEFFQSILNNMEKELVGAFLQDFLSSVSEQTLPTNKRLLLSKNLLSLTPKYAFPTLHPPERFQNWLLSIVLDTVNATSSLRCVGLAILLILVKNMRKESLKLTEIGNAISCNIIDACTLLSAPAFTDESFQFGRLLLHQCADNLSPIGDETSPWTQPIGDCVYDVSNLLRAMSVASPLFQGSGPFLVDLCKLFNKVVTIWFTQCQPSNRATEGAVLLPTRPSSVQTCDTIPLFRGSPECVFLLVNSQPTLVHDSFQSAFHSALELSYRTSSLLDGRDSFTGDVARAWVDRISHAIEALLNSPPVEEGDHSMDLGRVESLLLLLGCVLGLRAELAKGEDSSVIEIEMEASWVTSARLTFGLIVRTMARLKSLISSVPPKKQKVFRSFASNVRKASIALAEIALVSCPLSLRCPLLGDSPEAHVFLGEEFISSFCLKTLSTPSLFPQIYRALTIPPQLNFGSSPSPAAAEEVDTTALIQTIVRHLSTGLRQIAQYSMPAAIDLIATVDELANAGCLEIVSSNASDTPLSVLTASAQVPKSGAAAAPSDIFEWKSQCLECLSSILELSCANPSVQCSDQFLETFAGRVPQTIAALHQCLGNMSTRALKVDTPSARDKVRKDALASVASSFGTTNTEELVPLLQNLVELLNKYLDAISAPSAHQHLSPQISSPLLELFTFLGDICHRPLLFEDDCSLLCSEIDLMGKLASLLDQEGTREECGTLFPFRDSFRGKLQEVELRVARENLLDPTQTKMIRDICQFHLI